MLDEPRLIAHKYAEFSGVTPELAEPYFIAAFLAGASSAHTLALRQKQIDRITAQPPAALPPTAAALIGPRDKSISSTASGYRSELASAVDAVYRNRSTATGLTDRMGELLERYADQIFREGLIEGGVEEDEELSPEERGALDAWRTEQLTHVDGFADAVASASDVPAREAIDARLDLWVKSLVGLGNLARGYAIKDRSGVWRLGATEEHCSTCSLLHQKRHRVSWYLERGYIPREVGSATLECKGFACLCGVYDPKTGDRLL